MAALVFGPRYTCNRHRRFWRRIRFRLSSFSRTGLSKEMGKPKRRGLAVAISIVAVVAALVHLRHPDWAIDGKTVALLVIAILPWLGSIFESVELPGGWKVRYRDLKNAEIEAEKIGLVSPLQTDRKSTR